MGWYRALLPPLSEKKLPYIYLYFEGVDEQAWIYLNGKLISEQTTKSTGLTINQLWKKPFVIDITNLLRSDGPNLLAVRVHNEMFQGGIYKPVNFAFSDIEPNAEKKAVEKFNAQAKITLTKTTTNTLRLICQGNTVELPIKDIKADDWVHLAVSWDATTPPGRIWMTVNGKGLTAAAANPLQPVSYGVLSLGNELGKDVPLDGIIDELHVTDETLADRTLEGKARLAALPVDWVLYQHCEDTVRMALNHLIWPNERGWKSRNLYNKYGGMIKSGWNHLRMYEIFGDLWFLDQAENIGKAILNAQKPEGHLPVGLIVSSDWSVEWQVAYSPDIARLQDGFQDVPMRYLAYLYRLTGKSQYLDAIRKVGDLFIEAQNPNGSWSGEYNVKTKKGHIADSVEVLQGGEFDDGGIRRPFATLLFVYHVTKDEKYLKPLVKCADWVLEAEIVGSGARGWAGFYDANNNPVQARTHEYPKIMTQVFVTDIGHLMIWAYHLTGNPKYLEGIRPALKWYQQHRDPELGWAAFYEKDGTAFKPTDYYSSTGMYGPKYGLFQDITYIEQALGRLDKGALNPSTSSLKVTDQALEKVRQAAIASLKSPHLNRWAKRDVRLLTQKKGRGVIPRLIEYIASVRVAAGKVPPKYLITGAPLPAGTMGGNGRCWFVEDWFDTPLRKK